MINIYWHITYTEFILQNVKAKSSNQTPVQSSTPLNNLSSLASNLKIEIGLDDDLNIPVETDQSAIKNNVNRTSSIDEVEIACPITRKGDFFKDSYFESVWKDFDNAMGDMVDRQKGRKEKREQATREKELSRLVRFMCISIRIASYPCSS